MKIGGFQKVSLIDYPGEISSVVFTQGCNFRCVYCHNPELVYPQLWGPSIEPQEILQFLHRRSGKVDAVVLTGGEPLLQEDLRDFILQIKEMGFLVKLDTNGSYPDRLAAILEEGVLNYVAMDVKAPWSSYGKVTGVQVDVEKVKASTRIILSSRIESEFRVTFVPSLMTESDVETIGQDLKGAKRLVIQKYRPRPQVKPDTGFKDLLAPSKEELQRLKSVMEKIIPCVVIRE